MELGKDLKIYKIFNKKSKEYQKFGYRNKDTWFKIPRDFWNDKTDFEIYELHIYYYELDSMSSVSKIPINQIK